MMMDKEHIALTMGLFWAAILLIMCVASYHDIAGYEFNTCLFCALFCLVPYLFYHFGLLKLPIGFIVLIHVAIFLHATGVMFFAYDFIMIYDNVTHTYSSIVVSACVMLTLFTLQRYNSEIRMSARFSSIFAVLIMTTFGIIWEVFEYVVDLVAGTHMQYCPWDTVRDMLCNTLGSIICSIGMYLYMRNRSVYEFVDSIELHPALVAFLNEKKAEL